MTLPQARSQRPLPQRLLELSESLLPAASERGRPDPAKLRRSISTAYYALFSLLVEAGATAIAGTGPQSRELRAVLSRTFEHGEMSNVCIGFANRNPADRWKKCLDNQSVSSDLACVAANFRNLQQARHEADYDILKKPKKSDARKFVDQAKQAFTAWNTIKMTPEAKVFLLALVFDKKAERRA
jgi:uncharacterized protein (UPF0332 family)